MYAFPCCTIAVQYAALLFATIFILHFYKRFSALNFCMHLLPFKTKIVDSRKLHIESWFVYRRTTSMGDNFIRSTTTLLELIVKAHATWKHAQFFKHDVLAWLPPFASLSVSAQPISASTNASSYMSFHIFFRR